MDLLLNRLSTSRGVPCQRPAGGKFPFICRCSTIPGTGGEVAVQVMPDVMYAKAPYTVVRRAMDIHLTSAECLPAVLPPAGTLCVMSDAARSARALLPLVAVRM